MWNDEKWCFECEYYYYDSFHDKEYCYKHHKVMNTNCANNDHQYNYAKNCDDYLNCEQVRKDKIKKEYLFDKWE